MLRLLPPLVLAAAALTAALSTACAPATERAANADITDSAGVAIVRGPAADDALPWTFTEIRRLGGADTGAQAFDAADAYTVATDGVSRIAVLDARNDNRVHLFDADGVLLRTVGGKGGGPGEMEYPQGIALERTGRLSAVDAAKSALLRWDAQGTGLSPV